MKTKDELPECPVATTVQLIGSKWKLLILRNLLARPWRFNELKRNLEGISQKVLTDSLRSMEEDGIIKFSLGMMLREAVAFLGVAGIHEADHQIHGRIRSELQNYF